MRVETDYGNGTGFIFETTAQGGALILTNYHVVEDSWVYGSWVITVRVNDSETYHAPVVGYDAYRDLAVLEICCGDFRALSMSPPAEIKAGTEVMAIGYPLQITGASSVTGGIVSAYRYDPDFHSWVVQTDAPINPGSSGGPLILPTGEVIGINTFAIRGNFGFSAEGLGFAISQQSINEVLSDMKQGAQVNLPTPTPTLTPTPSPTPKPTPVRWQTYNNGTYRYTIEVPRDWKINDIDKSFVYFDSNDQSAGVTVESYNWQVELEKWADQFVDLYKSDSGSVFNLRNRDVKQRANGTGGSALIILTRKPVGYSYCLEHILIVMLTSLTRSYAVTSVICNHSFSQYSEITRSILLDKFSPY